MNMDVGLLAPKCGHAKPALVAGSVIPGQHLRSGLHPSIFPLWTMLPMPMCHAVSRHKRGPYPMA